MENQNNSILRSKEDKKNAIEQWLQEHKLYNHAIIDDNNNITLKNSIDSLEIEYNNDIEELPEYINFNPIENHTLVLYIEGYVKSFRGLPTSVKKLKIVHEKAYKLPLLKIETNLDRFQDALYITSDLGVVNFTEGSVIKINKAHSDIMNAMYTDSYIKGVTIEGELEKIVIWGDKSLRNDLEKQAYIVLEKGGSSDYFPAVYKGAEAFKNKLLNTEFSCIKNKKKIMGITICNCEWKSKGTNIITRDFRLMNGDGKWSIKPVAK